VTAAAALAIVGMQVVHTYRRTLSAQDRATTRAVLAAVGPPIALGALLTVVLPARGLHALLPALWPILTGLCVFAARPHFPRGSGALALGYSLAGVSILGFLSAAEALQPWVMGLTFTLGQIAASAVFYWNLERDAGREEAP
jgi:hypothetical protein